MGIETLLQKPIAGFTASLLDVIRGASLADLQGAAEEARPRRAPHANGVRTAAPAPKPAKTSKSGRLRRRSPEEVAGVVTKIATLLAGNKTGLRAEQIRAKLDLDVREMPRVLKEGVEAGRLKVLSGQKRSTTYGAGKGGKAPRAAAKKTSPKSKPARKAAKKPAKKLAKKSKKS